MCSVFAGGVERARAVVKKDMPQLEQSSFIPKKSIPGGEKDEKKKTLALLPLIATVLFVFSLVLAGGVFLMKRLQVNDLERKKVAVEESREAFEPAIIERLTTFNRKMNIASELLNSHTTVTPFFELLESLTLRDVQFTLLSFDRLGEETAVKLEGIATDYATLALQSDKLGKNQYIKNPIFSNFTVDEDDNVQFSVELTLDESYLLYSEHIDQ